MRYVIAVSQLDQVHIEPTKPDQQFVLVAILPGGVIKVRPVAQADPATAENKADVLRGVFVPTNPAPDLGSITAESLLASTYPFSEITLANSYTDPDLNYKIEVANLPTGEYYVYVLAGFPG